VIEKFLSVQPEPHVDHAPWQSTFCTHWAELKNPNEQVASPTAVKPLSHDTVHDEPCAKLPFEQLLPKLPFRGATMPVQSAGAHTTDCVMFPAKHDGCCDPAPIT
jgi:hypothetical protein